MRLRFASIPLLIAALAAGCSGESQQPETPSDPGVKLPPTQLSPDQKAQLDALMAEKQASANMSADDFKQKYAPSFTAGISYDPSKATGLDIVQGSALALGAGELAALGKNGFVISENRKFPSFVYGYDSLYAMDLPLYVSADSILFAVHKSYDAILKAVEMSSLMPQLGKMLASMRNHLDTGGGAAFSAEARADADLLLAVTLALLNDQTPAPVAGADPTLISNLVNSAKSHEGVQEVSIFGTKRLIDFSQFTPRGHYTDSPELTRYFRAMMWLGRTDLRIIETQEDGSQVFRRRQLEGAFVLRDLTDQDGLDRYQRIDTAIGTFVGENDYMTLPQVDGLMKDLGISSGAELSQVPDAKIAQVVLQNGYGSQRIASAVMINGLGDATLPLSSSFALLGQRYVLDSHVFSNVTYSRVQGGKVRRMMPNPLDVGFAALGNDQAGQLLLPEIQKYSYAPDLHMMRVLVDAHQDTYWGENLYNRWLGTLRTLSPQNASGSPDGLPEVAKTEAWGRRLLNTQLASWAELRHDTILYAKQSYSDGAGCYFPDAYVDPYPAFYDAIGKLAEHGTKMVEGLDLSADPSLGQNIVDYFATLHNVAGMLGAMAQNERAGQPHTAEQMAFINQAVHIQFGCGDPWGADGWYSQLFFDQASGIKLDPTIADVHTQPTDEGGNPVGHVLHVGTGQPRMMVVTTEGCGTPKAYVGLASSYFERITDNFERLNDKEWTTTIQQATPADVPWMQDIVPR